jgi:hypothetical protein
MTAAAAYDLDEPPLEDEPEFISVAPPPAEAGPTSWRPVDLDRILSGDYVAPVPTIGIRSDGVALLYPGRTHTSSGESETAKSLCEQFINVQELSLGNGVVYLDFEDDEASVTARHLYLGALPSWLRDHFAYIHPDEPITSPGGRRDLDAAMGDLKPTLVVLDGVTEAMSLHGLDPDKGPDIAKFGRLITKPLADTGAAVNSIDHVTKSADGRGRYAIGSVHKLNNVTGAAFVFENIHRFGKGLAGRSRIFIAKDRPGQLRAHALPGGNDRYWLADFTTDDTLAPDVAELWAPVERTEPFTPTAVMGKVAAVLIGRTDGLSGKAIQDRVGGRADIVRQATAALIDQGYITVTAGTRGAHLHTLTRDYPDGGAK